MQDSGREQQWRRHSWPCASTQQLARPSSLIANRPSRSHDLLPPHLPHWHPKGKSIFLTWNSMAPRQPPSSEPPAQPGMAVPRKTPPAENSSYWTQLWTPPLPGLSGWLTRRSRIVRNVPFYVASKTYNCPRGRRGQSQRRALSVLSFHSFAEEFSRQLSHNPLLALSLRS
jgi:hypothetical protein